MAIPFTCPHCAAETEVAAKYAGRSGPCAHCGRTITVPPLGTALQATGAKRTSRALVLGLVTLGVLGVVVLGGGALVALLLPAVRSARQAAHRSECTNKLQQIATAVFEYRRRYDVFPPACITDEQGRPMHSWRLLILPYLGYQALYDQYDFSQPWDSPQNRALTDMISDVYRCPADTGGRATDTSYLMIVGPGTISTLTTPPRFNEIPDGAAHTIMLVETVNSGIRWSEPRDFDVEQTSFEINDPARGQIRSNHPGGVNAAMCDGSTLFLGEWTTPEQVQAMTTIAGGEPVRPD